MDGSAPDRAPSRAEYDVPVGRITGSRRTVTLNASRASKVEIHRLRAEHNEETIAEYERPRTRGDCLPGGCNGARPCPWVSCTRHLALDVDEETGSVKLNFPGLEVWEMSETCSIDAADRGGLTLEEVGARMNLTRERTRQIETRALSQIASHGVALSWRDGPPVKVRAPSPSLARGGTKRYARRGEFRSLAHLHATAVLSRGGTIEEASSESGLTRHQVQQLAWRMAARARAQVNP